MRYELPLPNSSHKNWGRGGLDESEAESEEGVCKSRGVDGGVVLMFFFLKEIVSGVKIENGVLSVKCGCHAPVPTATFLFVYIFLQRSYIIRS